MPALRRTTDLTFIVAGLTLMVVLSVASFVLAPEDGAPAHSGSSFASHPAGAKGAFVFLQEAGYNVRRSLEPLTAIDTPPARTVLVLADPLEAPSQQDLAALKQFVEAGG
ncbi:MAG TPA: DUF4350 domain-containing protein, partial [Vicinamibacterales bacterium]|nr:DUF4350 domain-containing protein [Vicinamibacterales bacterium]